MSTQHTPGPWSVFYDEDDEDVREWLAITTVDPRDESMDEEVAVVNVSRTIDGKRYEHGSLADREADARLIAAAPTMLMALEAVVEEGDDCLGLACHALAEAKGELRK